MTSMSNETRALDEHIEYLEKVCMWNQLVNLFTCLFICLLLGAQRCKG